MEHERILLDIEVQRDFFTPGGSCYLKEASRYAARIYDLFDWAKANRMPVISTVLRVPRSRRGPLADVPHCVEGTDGERKVARTVLHSRVNLGLRNTTDLPEDLFRKYRQVIFEKRHTDIFFHARAERLITRLSPGTFVVCGAGLAWGVAQASIGLRNRGFAVIVASDAVLDLADPKAEMARLRMEAKGALFLPTNKIITAGVPACQARTRRVRPTNSPGRPVLQG